MHADMAKVLITKGQIQERVREIGAQISIDYRGVDNLLLVGVLKGCAMFMMDLVREVDIPLSFDFIAVASYGYIGVEILEHTHNAARLGALA
ncbi:MAG: hypothetical protein HGA19_24885, partial [Oscillochloris sp.]|nr:hypothetical protein [Oscillochloris sp.]